MDLQRCLEAGMDSHEAKHTADCTFRVRGKDLATVVVDV